MCPVLHPLNFQVGWAMVLAGMLTGAGLGIFFHREDFWGGYSSFRRRIVRLGHIALMALGMLNVLFSISVPADNRAAATLMLIGGLSMPMVCFLAGWRISFRHLFALPVLALILGVIFTLVRGGG